MKKNLLLIMMLFAIISVNAQLGTYQFQDQTDSNFGSFSSMTTLYSGANYDTEETTGIPIGFDFKYNGHTYNSVTIGVDGVISFTATNLNGQNDLAGTSASQQNVIAPFWDDFVVTTSTGTISYKTYGAAPNRGFVVEWRDVQRYQTTGTISFRLFLKETTNYIKFQYGTNDIVNDASAIRGSIGFNAYDGSNTTFVSVTPGTPATVSTTTANNQVFLSRVPVNKIYTFSPQPVNDYYNLPTTITLNDCAHPIAAYNAGATDSGGSDPTCGGFTGTIRDIWYQFTAPQQGAIKIKRLNEGDWSSMSFAIYHGTGISGNTPVFCDYIYDANDSREIYNLIPGDTYLVRMWDFNNNDFGYTYFCVESLNNDANTQPFPIDVQAENASSYVEYLANNNGATGSPNAAPSCGSYNGGDIWFKFTAPANGNDVAVVHSDTAGDWSSMCFAVYSSAGSNSAITCDFILISGYSAPYDTKIISGLTAGTEYWLRMWDWGNDNFGNTLFYLREDTTSGVEDYTSLDFNYYPNPANDMLNVTAKENISGITLTNMMGQQVINATPNSQEVKLNIAHLPQGIYMMNVMMGDKSKTVKIIKK